MSSNRDDVDLARVLAEAVAPALTEVFRPGEVQSVSLAWENPVSLPDGRTSEPTELNVNVICNGSQHRSQIWQLGVAELDLAATRQQLANEFAGFVAESEWGWGQQR